MQVLIKINFIIGSTGQLKLPGSVQLAECIKHETTALHRNYETVNIAVNLGRVPFSADLWSSFARLSVSPDVSQAPGPGACHCLCQSCESRGEAWAPTQQGVAMEPATSPVPWKNIFMSLGVGRDTPGLFDLYSGPPVPKGPNGFFNYLLMSALALGES